MSRNIMSIGRIMYSKMPTKRKLSDFYGFGLPSNLYVTGGRSLNGSIWRFYFQLKKISILHGQVFIKKCGNFHVTFILVIFYISYL